MKSNVLLIFLAVLAVVSVVCFKYDNKVEYDYYEDHEKEDE